MMWTEIDHRNMHSQLNLKIEVSTRKVGVRHGVQQLPARIALDGLGILCRRRDCTPGKDEALQQGVGGEAVGAVQAGGGDLPGRKQAADARLPMQARLLRADCSFNPRLTMCDWSYIAAEGSVQLGVSDGLKLLRTVHAVWDIPD